MVGHFSFTPLCWVSWLFGVVGSRLFVLLTDFLVVFVVDLLFAGLCYVVYFV